MHNRMSSMEIEPGTPACQLETIPLGYQAMWRKMKYCLTFSANAFFGYDLLPEIDRSGYAAMVQWL